MKKLLKWICHPIACYRYTRDKEQMLMFCAACIYNGIEDPTVWDVDRLTEAIDQNLAFLHLDPSMFDGMPIVRRNLFWTRLISRFKLMKFNRDHTRHYVEAYGFLKSAFAEIPVEEGKKKFVPDPAAIFQTWEMIVSGLVFG